MSKYAPKISGYANASKSEYLAESFSAYIKGEIDKLDKDYVGFLDKKLLEKSTESGIIKSEAISGALNPISDEAEKHAKTYYQAIRKMTPYCKRIAENTGYTEEQIKEIKDFIFMCKHDLGQGKLEYFVPNYEMAQSWQRLIEGKNIQPHDLTLLRHEIMEKELMLKGMTQDEAHIATSKVYNYKKECEEYYAEIEKHKKNG